MAWSFRKRIKIIPGVHFNFSKSGITTSIGVRGASLTIGKSGTYLNTGIPALGLYHREKLTGKNNKPLIDPQTFNEHLVSDQSDNIFSADVQEITSQDMQGIKEAILLAHQQRLDLQMDLRKIQFAATLSVFKLAASYILIYGLVKKAIAENIRVDLLAQKEAVKQTKQQIENCFVKLEVDFEPHIQEKYDALIRAFQKLTSSHRIWDVTSAHYQDRVAARSSASTLVNKRDVRFTLKSLPDIKSDLNALYFQNANGADLYFYPSFIIMYSSKTSFAVIGFDEIQFNYRYVRFTETGSVPPDSTIIDRTWAKVNKNGTPDKRFKNNYQIPIVKYGEISLQTNTGLNEEYEFSNYEYTEEFGRAFVDYQNAIRKLRKL
ncbi:hypothetical protein ASG33_11525 [Dyadobacter sp. Leaf189]|nr:hypothetical protein ASG33_11525 [Dyadobacter sp. Leaf189]